MRAFARSQPLRRNPPSFYPARRRNFAVSPTRRNFLHTSPFRRPQEKDAGAQIQEVKILKPAFAWRRLALIAGYAGASYFISKYFFHGLVEKLGIEEGELEEIAEEDEESWFIAFQYPKKLPPTFYRQSDPEWQEFVKMSNNEDRKDSVKDELAQRVTHDISAHPRMQMRLGKDIELTKYWLELKYPDSPPPQYARQGIEIANDYIAWSTQVIPQTHYAQLKHILFPVAVCTAFSNSVRILLRLQAIKLKNALGLSLTPMDKQIQAVAKLERTQRQLASQKAQLESLQDGSPSSGAPNSARPEFTHPRHPHAQQKEQTSSQTTTATSSKVAQPSPQTPTPLPSGAILPAVTNLPPDLAIAFKMFVSSLIHAWFSGRTDSEARGTFLVVGQVEVTGDRGKVKCDVKAAYDPKEGRYLYVRTTVKHFWELRQSAKGGP